MWFFFKNLYLMNGKTTASEGSERVSRALAYVLNGTFLEYFDVMLMAHLSFILVPLFAPPASSAETSRFYESIAFSMSFMVRPFGALFWGAIGDSVGRVFVLFCTTLLMSASCLLIPNIPSYASAGSWAMILFLFARLLQGLSSSGEIKAAEIYIAELMGKHPAASCITATIHLMTQLSGCVALLLVALFTSGIFPENGWRGCFYVGAGIAGISALFRRNLSEPAEFLHQTVVESVDILTLRRRFALRNFVCLIFINMTPALVFMMAYDGLRPFLQGLASSTPTSICLHNAGVAFTEACVIGLCALVSLRIDAFKIFYWRTAALFVTIPLAYWILQGPQSSWSIYVAQILILSPIQGIEPATPYFIRGFPPRTRFRGFGISWAFSRALGYGIAIYGSSKIYNGGGLETMGVFILISAALRAVASKYFVSEEQAGSMILKKCLKKA